MKKTILFPMLGLALVGAVVLTAFSVQPVIPTDQEPTFEAFLKQFPKQNLPYTLDKNALKSRLDQYVSEINNKKATSVYDAKPKRLDWKYLRFLPDLEAVASFSRMPIAVEPVAVFATAENYAVLYNTNRGFGSGYCNYGLAVLNKKGEQISSNEVGGVMPQTIISSTISTDLRAELTTWRINWKQDYVTNGMDGNKITGLTLVESSSLDLMKPTQANSHRFKREMLAPKVPEQAPAEVEVIKTK